MIRPNELAIERLDSALQNSALLKIDLIESSSGARVVDFGVEAVGGLQAGILLSEICMGRLGHVKIAADTSNISTAAVFVSTDYPLLACMACQYAGWPISVGKYFAMGSGPMRINRGREGVLTRYANCKLEPRVIGVLETNDLPGEEVIQLMAEQCHVTPDKLTLCVAPTRSMAGMIQIVARSVEATMHKLFELDFDLNNVVHALGSAPLPPSGGKTVSAIGRSNDAILYGGKIQLWLDVDNKTIDEIAPLVPSDSSKDFGRPFKDIFESYNQDFYAIDKMLFSSAQVTLSSVQTGHTVTVGKLLPDLLRESFFG